MRLNTNPVPHVTKTKDGQLLVGTWRHGGHAGGEEPKYISPLGTKLHFHTNVLRKILFYWPPTLHGRLVTWLQTKTAERLKIVSSKPAIKLERIRICLLKIMKQFTKSDREVFAGCKIIYCCHFCLLSATQTRYRTPMPRYWEEDDCKENPITRKVWLRGMRTRGRKLHVLVNCSEVKKGLQSDYKEPSLASKLIKCHVFAARGRDVWSQL